MARVAVAEPGQVAVDLGAGPAPLDVDLARAVEQLEARSASDRDAALMEHDRDLQVRTRRGGLDRGCRWNGEPEKQERGASQGAECVHFFVQWQQQMKGR